MDGIEQLTDPTGIRFNRDGRLAPDQFASLSGQARRSRLRRVAGFVACVAAAAVFVALASSLGDASTVTVLGLVVVAASAAVFRPWADPLGTDLRDGRVDAVTGTPVSAAGLRRVATNAWLAEYTVSIAARRFRVAAATWSAIDDGRLVRAFYLPRSATLVSIESADDRAEPPVLPPERRRRPLRPGWTTAAIYFGAVGAGLVVNAFLPPGDLTRSLPVGIAFLIIAGAIVWRSMLPR